MSNRRATPDILGEILGTPASEVRPHADEAGEGAPGAAVTNAPAAARKSRPRKPATQPQPVLRTAWEYMTVTLGEHNGWRPRMVNQTALENWTYQPLLCDFLNIVGGYGWELTAIIDVGRSRKEAFFKRPKV